MTEKRFTFNCDSNWWTISDNTTNDERLWGQDVVDKLNELTEENTRLKNKLKFLNELNKPYGTIIEENQKLKRQIEDIIGMPYEEY